MKKKVILKKVIILFTLIAMLFMQSNTYATTIDSIISGADSFEQAGKNAGTATISASKLKETSTTIYNILLAIAIVAALIVATYLGIKFMLASAVEKAEIKESLIPFIIGCFIAFGAFGIWKIAMMFAS